jgi:hypothetical protein
MTYDGIPAFRRIRPPLFKYLPWQYAIGLLERGSVRIGTAYDFRRVEAHDPARGDPSEAKPDRLALVDEFSYAPGARVPNYLTSVYGHSSQPYSVRDSIIEDVSIPDRDYFIYCLSAERKLELYQEFNAPACIEIRDVRGFLDCLNAYLASRTLGVEFGHVTYGSRFGPYGEAHERTPPFVKHPKYRPQAEVRFAWTPRDDVEVKPFNAEVDGLGKFCRLLPWARFCKPYPGWRVYPNR